MAGSTLTPCRLRLIGLRRHALGEGVELALERGWDVEQRVRLQRAPSWSGPAAGRRRRRRRRRTLGRFLVAELVVLELLCGGNAGPAVAVVAAVLPRVAATLIIIVILLVRPPLALLALLLTNLALIPLGRPVESEGLA